LTNNFDFGFIEKRRIASHWMAVRGTDEINSQAESIGKKGII